MHYLVADIARTITLVPGDVLLSGTPGQLAAGPAGRRRRGRGRGPRPAAPTTSSTGPIADPRRRAAPSRRRARRSLSHRARRRLGVPRRPDAVQGPLPRPPSTGPTRSRHELKVVVDLGALPGPRAVRLRRARGLRARRGRQARTCSSGRARRGACATRSRRPRTCAPCRPSRSRARRGRPVTQTALSSSAPAWPGCASAEALRAQGSPARSSSSGTRRWRAVQPSAAVEGGAGRRARATTTARLPGAQRAVATSTGGSACRSTSADLRGAHGRAVRRRRRSSYDALVAATGVSARRLPSRARRRPPRRAGT